jgi:hypothetical protein
MAEFDIIESNKFNNGQLYVKVDNPNRNLIAPAEEVLTNKTLPNGTCQSDDPVVQEYCSNPTQYHVLLITYIKQTGGANPNPDVVQNTICYQTGGNLKELIIMTFERAKKGDNRKNDKLKKAVKSSTPVHAGGG